MRDICSILGISSGAEFEKTALELFRYQSVRCPPYREFLSLIGCDPTAVNRTEQIPFLPISLFKTHNVYCGETPPEVVFTSSTTGGGSPSRHPMASVEDYERTFLRAFTYFYGAAGQWSIYALLPGYLERTGSSLVHMADRLITTCGRGGFYLREHDKLITDMSRDSRPKILLGVTYALLDLAGSHSGQLHDTIIMETGGMKGEREELPKHRIHALLREAFHLDAVHSEYGMAELSSQAYSLGNGLFRTPPWMRVWVRDPNDPFRMVGHGKAGGINIIDLANTSSCAFIQTDDMGVTPDDGTFRITGRMDRSEIRGCNLLVQ